MDIMEAIHSRGSVKSFRQDPVSREVIEKLLDAAIRAPNHKLTEPWTFYVVTGETKRRFAELRRDVRAQKFDDPDAPEVQASLESAYQSAANTPAIIVVTTLVADDPVQRDEDYAAACCAIQNILLAALSLNLGTYLRTGAIIYDQRLHDLLSVPEDHRIVGCVFLGYPAEMPKRKPRTPAVEKMHWLS